jgi:serine/threonine-protein kinase
MAEVAAELHRFLANQPIHAKAPGLFARSGKWCRRHPVVATSSAIVCVALLALSLLLFETMRARSAAVHAAKTARLEADTSSRVVDFLVGAFSDSSPTRTLGRELSAREVLDRGVRNIREGLRDPREAGLRARLLNSLGMVYSRLGLRAQAEDMLREAQALGEQAFGASDAHTLAIGSELAILLTESNRLQEALDQWKAVHAGWVLLEGASSKSALRAEGSLGAAYSRAGQAERAETHLRHSISGLEQLGAWRGQALYTLSEVLRSTGRLDESLAMLRLCIEAHERELGSDAPDTLNAQEGLARHFLAARDLQSAARVWREVAAARSCVQGATHPATIAARSRVLLLESGKNPEASLYGLNELFSVAMRDLGPGSSTTLDLARLLGSLYEGRGRHAEAEHLFAQLLGAQAAAPLSSA